MALTQSAEIVVPWAVSYKGIQNRIRPTVEGNSLKVSRRELPQPCAMATTWPHSRSDPVLMLQGLEASLTSQIGLI